MFDPSAPEDASEVLDRFVDNLPGIAYRCEPEAPWKMTFLRGQVESLTGYDSAEFEANDVSYGSLVLAADHDDLERTVQRAVEERRQFTANYRIETRTGETKHVFERGVPVVENGGTTALEGIIVDVSQRKAYQERLHRQNDLFAHTQQLANVGGWELDSTSETLRWTDQAKRIHGLPLQASPSVDEAIEFYHPEDRPVIRNAVDRALAEGEPFDHELRIRTTHGEQRWVKTRGVPQVEDGEVVRLRGAIQDVTERLEREQSLRSEQAFTESILEAIPDPLYAFDETGSFTRWNDRFEEVTGYIDAEIAGMSPLDFVAEADRDRVREHVQRVLERGEATTVRAALRTKSGEEIPYELTGAPRETDADAHAELVGIGRDVSDRLQRERRFEAVFNNTYQFTGLVDTDGNIVEVNQAGLAFAGASRDDAIGTPLWDALEFTGEADEEAVKRGFQRAIDGEIFRDELRVVGHDRVAVIDFSIRPITDRDGEVTLLVPEGRDISEIKERERLLHVLHRLLRHNIRNDLNTVRGYADLVAEEIDDEATLDHLDRLTDAATNLLTTSEKAKVMMDSILDPHRGSEPAELRSSIESVAKRQRSQFPAATIEVRVDASGPLPVDPRVEVAVEQLVENGVEHNASEAPAVTVTATREGADAVVEIVDDGNGIADDEWAMVDAEVRDEQTQLRHGSGMGLLLTRWIVDDVGGQLAYDDRDTEGSVVSLRLPLAGGTDE
ncbi:signal-transducing histidine kinase [Salinarchaeum sp. Harcht-Bsk1]|uniref:PAS domain-containing protein n=1 Tax=Salinarchaeum sp. Harcht-Bsk1 TaxID=1333523 RepID=UPI0003423016|nr:PAS domain S-box protein [Salinarchaeum sp. Harcht-Bsk1]AGN01738.1 signal-transducing histidine kinase [Salinarchaeum sp. Harcht-Bsk1]